MVPIHELLSRIRWDPEFGRGEFVIGYYDRVEGAIVRVPLGELRFEPGDRFDFELIDAEGVPRTIPLHRIKAVYRNGELIWHREH
ncbi:DUF504 domain-containing protein [Thioalbus denitrificans]|uniref:Uncharacterized protein (UPF0248 family) n=1 Tax=Thioalbus denitrificans TaxID=547122 RepID=A0A369BTR6_9GAMM|nr:DUF504 domain-containing protein [Thioalbus denitrificans]RCX24953.1 uncharacterized protein (UPF0248 family) [Thioalbus denitrificans]